MTNTAVSAPFSQMKSIMNSGSRTPVSAEEVTVRFVSGTSSSTNSARSQFDGRAMRRAEENASRLVSSTPMPRLSRLHDNDEGAHLEKGSEGQHKRGHEQKHPRQRIRE